MPSPPPPPPYSYQHSPPNVVNVDEEKALFGADEGYFEFHQRRPRACFNRRRRGCGLLAPWGQSTVMLLASCIVVVLVGSVAFLNNSSASSKFSADYLSASMTEQGPPSLKDQAEGTYDWQKCQHSDDPDCWKKEGERVGSFWQNFGTEMSTYWSSWGHNMHEHWENAFHHNNVTDTTTPTLPIVNSTEILPEDVKETAEEIATTKLHHHTHHEDEEALAP